MDPHPWWPWCFTTPRKGSYLFPLSHVFSFGNAACQWQSVAKTLCREQALAMKLSFPPPTNRIKQVDPELTQSLKFGDGTGQLKLLLINKPHFFVPITVVTICRHGTLMPQLPRALQQRLRPFGSWGLCGVWFDAVRPSVPDEQGPGESMWCCNFWCT